MEHFVKLVAPIGKVDFVFRLAVLLLICGMLNHSRDVLFSGVSSYNPFYRNFVDAAWTALPMCTFGLMLVAHLNNLQRRLYRQATTDKLTQIRNRRWFLNTLDTLPDGHHALIMLDIDHFKHVNDRFGHEGGDLCLQLVAQHLQQTMRSSDCCARFGGEEFAVLLQNADSKTVNSVATRLCNGVMYEPEPGESMHVTLSAGVARLGPGVQPIYALRQADIALYQAKASGRARYAQMAALKPELAKPVCEEDPHHLSQLA